MPLFCLVCATRFDRKEFLAQSALGKTLQTFLPRAPIELRLFEQNTRGLSAVYNQAIEESRKDCIFIFLHDDLFLLDFFWIQRLECLLKEYALIGVAGNRRRQRYQPSWAHKTAQLDWDDPHYLSGVVGHGSGFPAHNVSYFGPAPMEVKLLDGCFLAIERSTLIDHQLRFDERFTFDFYDMDFCRQTESKGLKMATADLSVVHESGGNFGTPSWRVAYQTYCEKWENQTSITNQWIHDEYLISVRIVPSNDRSLPRKSLKKAGQG